MIRNKKGVGIGGLGFLLLLKIIVITKDGKYSFPEWFLCRSGTVMERFLLDFPVLQILYLPHDFKNPGYSLEQMTS